MITKWRKKPVVVKAVLLDDTVGSIVEASQFIYGKCNFPKQFVKNVRGVGGLMIQTLEGDMKADFGDYIIQGVKGEFYPCKPDVFHETYERELVWDENL